MLTYVSKISFKLCVADNKTLQIPTCNAWLQKVSQTLFLNSCVLTVGEAAEIRDYLSIVDVLQLLQSWHLDEAFTALQ